MNNSKNNNIFYILEVYIQGERLYVYTKRVALHFPDMAKKFVHRRSASRYYKDSEFSQMECYYRIVKFDKNKNKIII